MKKHTFYINNFYIVNNEIKLDSIDFKPIKRRLSLIDKAAIDGIEKIWTEDVEEIVFSSKHGELERLDKIIDDYKALNEVSPMAFSGSVHNYSAGSFCLVKKINIPYNCISSGDNSISNGIVKSMISKYNKVLFCYADVIDDEIKCFSCIISKKESKDSIKCEFDTERKTKNNKEFNSFCDFLKDKNKEFESTLGTLRKISK